MQQIIVYRNPMEAAFWELISAGEFWAIIVGIFVFFVVFLTLTRMMTTSVPRSYRVMHSPWKTYLPMAIAAVAGIWTIYAMISRI